MVHLRQIIVLTLLAQNFKYEEGIHFTVLKIQGPNPFPHTFIQICRKNQRKKVQTAFLWPDASWSNSFLLIFVVKQLTLARNGTQSEKSHSLPSEAESTNKHLTLATDCFL